MLPHWGLGAVDIVLSLLYSAVLVGFLAWTVRSIVRKRTRD